MKKLISILLIAFSINAFSQLQFPLDSNQVRSWVEHLASDELKGRENSSDEMREAAIWIKQMFEENQLKASKKFPHYIQDYTYTNINGNLKSERNIIGIIEGFDPKLKKEAIVITAHFDHVGIQNGFYRDSIYNGANDNASGVAGLIGISKLISDNNLKPGRTIVFVAFSTEEIGMYGSQHYVKNPAISLKKTYLNLNLEMLGLCKNMGANNFFFTGPQYSNLETIVKEYFSKTNWNYIENLLEAKWYFSASDNASFLKTKFKESFYLGVPAHTFVLNKGEENLHKPWDEAKYLNYSNMTSFIEVLTEFVIHLSWSKEKIDFKGDKYKRL